MLTQLVPLYYAMCRAEFVSLWKFRFGSSFSIANCNTRSWGQYTRNGSNLMMLMPNSAFSVEAKKRIKPWEKGSEVGSAGRSSVDADASPALRLAPSAGFNLLLQKRTGEEYHHRSPLATCSSICTLSTVHLWPYWAPTNVKSLTGRILPRTWPFPTESGINVLPTAQRQELLHDAPRPPPLPLLLRGFVPQEESRIYTTDFNGTFLSSTSIKRGNWAEGAKRAAWPANKNTSSGPWKVEFMTHCQQAYYYNVKAIIIKKKIIKMQAPRWTLQEGFNFLNPNRQLLK